MKYRYTFLFITLILLSQCSNEPGSVVKKATSGLSEDEKWVGDQECRKCHQDEFRKWKGSHHDLAMKPAIGSEVLGDFNDQEMELDGVLYRFFTERDTFWVETRELDGKTELHKIIYTFGVEPLQQYLVASEKGKKQVLRVSWDTNKKTWFHQYPGKRIDPNDWLHWTKGGQRWNTMCAECHSTGLKRNYFHHTDSFATTFHSVNVSCESCHGPGGDHSRAAAEGNLGKYPMLTGRSQVQQVNQCGPCHSRRERMLEDRQTRMAFDDQYIIQLLETGFYHADGQIREEDYVLGSFLQSKMYHNDVTCTDCHDPHTLQLKMKGNQLCTSCHEPEYDSPAHHFHVMGTESSQCVNCHMTGQFYMVNDFRRDHSFRIPRPDQSVTYGTPNACNGCHVEKTATWASEWVEKWYDGPPSGHFSDILLLTQNGSDLSEEEQVKVVEFIQDQEQPAIARATALRNLMLATPELERAYFDLFMNDPSPLIRRQAILRLSPLPGPLRMDWTERYWSDPSRMVRIALAEISMDIPEEDFPSLLLSNYRQAKAEYERMMISNLDFPSGRLQWGDALMKQGQELEAIHQFQAGLAMDSLLLPIYPSLATAFGRMGNLGSALNTLNSLLEMDPENSNGYFLRALVHSEMGNVEPALNDFRSSQRHDPENYRAYYNMAVLLFQQGRMEDAEITMKKGLSISPNDQRGSELLRMIRGAAKS